ncbi:MAG: nucleotidyl transferase AbiEii/AbiGii toxin family protein [Planctomycetes bacterium]|nr:nucleotidyl transferase AbiEii/AbiGii toxin family protein [Planctomycetota bacterium]
MFFRTLPASAQRVFTKLGRGKALDPFYLAGGSAAALHLGHRVSVDLDFFTPELYEPAALTPHLEKTGKVMVEQQTKGTFLGLIGQTKVSFFYYSYPLLEPAALYRGVRVASLLDIGLMKIVAISHRGRLRDFVDLHFICQAGYPLPDLLKRIPQKYATLTYPSYHILRALAYFDDAEKDPPLNMLVAYDWRRVKQFFEQQVRELARSL